MRKTREGWGYSQDERGQVGRGAKRMETQNEVYKENRGDVDARIGGVGASTTFDRHVRPGRRGGGGGGGGGGFFFFKQKTAYEVGL